MPDRIPEGHQGGAPPTDHTATHRRDRLAGLWAAELLGLIGQAAQDYARELVHADTQAAESDHRLVTRLIHDLQGKVSAQEIKAKLAHLLQEAKRQLTIERGGHGPGSGSEGSGP